MLTVLQKINRWRVIGGVFVTIFSLYAGASAIGLNLPRPAWISEVHAAERKIDSVMLRMEQLQLESLRRSWNNVVSRIAELESKNVDVPNQLLIEEHDLSNQIDAQRKYIIEIRSKN